MWEGEAIAGTCELWNWNLWNAFSESFPPRHFDGKFLFFVQNLSIPQAVKKACEVLVERLKPVRDEMKDAKWPDVTRAAHSKLIDLSATHLYIPTETQGYAIYGLSCAEIETDILTGNILLRRVDILEDTGESMSPLVDVGQVSLVVHLSVQRELFFELGGRLVCHGHWLLANRGTGLQSRQW